MLDGAPVVGQDKADRLLKAITKTASKEAGIAVQTHQIEMPVDEQGQSKGFMFVSLHNPTEAQVFQRALDGYAFDKRHTLSVVPFTEVESYANLDDNYVEPEQDEWAPRVSSAPNSASRVAREADHRYSSAGALPCMARRPRRPRPAHPLRRRRPPRRLDRKVGRQRDRSPAQRERAPPPRHTP